MKKKRVLEAMVYTVAIVLSLAALLLMFNAGDLFNNIRLVYQMF